MAIDIQQELATYPIASCDQDLFSMVVDVVQDTEYERVTVPGVIIQDGDPEFVTGVYYGRICYFEEVYALLDLADNELKESTLEELAALQEVKVRDVTTTDVVKFIMEAAHEKNIAPAWLAGFIFGYVTACSDQFYGLVCENCWRHRGECDGRH